MSERAELICARFSVVQTMTSACGSVNEMPTSTALELMKICCSGVSPWFWMMAWFSGEPRV